MFCSFLSLCFVFLSILHSTKSTVYHCNASSSCGCSKTQISVTAKIIGGEPAENHAWPWSVSLRRFSSHICGGSLLNATFAITVAHCVYGLQNSPSIFSIRAGSNYLSGSDGQIRTVTKIYMHPNYNEITKDNDIALIQFLPLSSSSSIAFICLPAANIDPFTSGENLVAIGWGVLHFGSSTASNSLQQVTLQAVASGATDCLRMRIGNTSLKFCAGVSSGGKDTCQGDSGGPLMVFSNNRWVLAGLTSTGYECALGGYPGLYTRVSHFIPYINSTIGIPSSSQTLNSSTSTGTLVAVLLLVLRGVLLIRLV